VKSKELEPIYSAVGQILHAQRAEIDASIKSQGEQIDAQKSELKVLREQYDALDAASAHESTEIHKKAGDLNSKIRSIEESVVAHGKAFDETQAALLSVDERLKVVDSAICILNDQGAADQKELGERLKAIVDDLESLDERVGAKVGTHARDIKELRELSTPP